MNILFVFDSSVIINNNDLRSLVKGDKLFILQLSSSPAVVEDLAAKIEDIGCEIIIIPAAKMLNAAGEELRAKYLKFIAELPSRVSEKAHNLKEYFAIDTFATLWWVSLIAEKNTFKSDFFNSLAQLQAITTVAKKENIEKIFFGGGNKKLQKALGDFAATNSISYKICPVYQRTSLRTKIRNLQQHYYFKHLLLMLCYAASLFMRTLKIKRHLRKSRRQAKKGSMIIISYYPNYDIGLSKEGIFKNNYYATLQESLEAEGQEIIWIVMMVKGDLASLNESLALTKEFIQKHNLIYFLEEFNSFYNQFKALWLMLKSGRKFRNMEKWISGWHDFGDYNFYPILKDDWYASFVGRVGYAGVAYYEMFKSLLKEVPELPILYYCEMHAWEKALLSAKKAMAQKSPMLAYQHATVSKMLLNYFNHPVELEERGPYPLPKPNKIICNGKLPEKYFKECGWPEERLVVVEAIRYGYLKKYLQREWIKKENIVLVAFSINPEEGSALLNITYEALRDLKGLRVWLRPHPFLQVEKVFENSAIPREQAPFEVNREPLEEILPRVKMLIVGESGLSLEGLAFGCKIITVDTPEMVNMSPLRDIKSGLVRHVASSDELRKEVIGTINEDYDMVEYRYEAEKIINDFFYLGGKTEVPNRFMQLLNQYRI